MVRRRFAGSKRTPCKNVAKKPAQRFLRWLGAVVLLLPSVVFPQSNSRPKEELEKRSSGTKLRIEVTGGDRDQPVENASVYVKYAQPRALAKDKKIEMNLKTNREGVVKVPEIPRGKVLIQVIAEGWKTFGRWYNVEEEQQTIRVRLEKPPRWY